MRTPRHDRLRGPTRRRVLSTAVALLGASIAGGVRRASGTARSQWSLGVQSYSFRAFDVAGALERLAELGLQEMEFYPGHFPPVVSDTGTIDAKQQLASAKVQVPAFGVLGFTADEEKNRTLFEFARDFGIGILTADPDPDSFPSLEPLCREFDVQIAIHNHGPGHRWSSVGSLSSAIEALDPRVGVCLDTGHALRSGFVPQEMLRELGDRVHSLHLKDWVHGGEEQILGEGDLDLEAVASALIDIDFDGPISLEYELQPEDPVPGLKKGLENWQRVLERL